MANHPNHPNLTDPAPVTERDLSGHLHLGGVIAPLQAVADAMDEQREVVLLEDLVVLRGRLDRLIASRMAELAAPAPASVSPFSESLRGSPGEPA